LAWIVRFVATLVALVILTAAVGTALGAPLASFGVPFPLFFLALLGLSAAVASAPALLPRAEPPPAAPRLTDPQARLAAPPRAEPAKSAAPAPAAPSPATLVEALQARAKAADDAHKAEARAHVERAVPPITEAGQAAIAAALGAHVAIRHVFPPRLPQRGLSYLGGVPITPDAFDWPTVHNRGGELERLHFVAQLDCRDLPPQAHRLLPDKGILYFFAPLSDRLGPEASHFVVRYLPGPVTKRWTPQEWPFVRAIEPADDVARVWPGRRTRFDRVEVAFGWMEEPSDAEVEARSEEGFPHEVAERIRQERLGAFFGEAPADPLLSPPPPSDALWWPYPEFPHNWKAARVLRTFVEAWQREAVNTRLRELGDPSNHAAAAADPLVQQLRRLGSQISNAFFPSISAARADVDAPSDEDKQKIRAVMELLWREELPAELRLATWRWTTLISRWIAAAATAGGEAGLVDPAGAAHVPPGLVAALAPRHATRAHRMFGHGDVVQTAADDMRDRYVLLLQLGPDAALGWWFGEMGPLQYWITPEDLAARRFENTVLTIEAW
jgi:hypothetical protein